MTMTRLGKLSIGFSICRRSSSRYSSVICSIWLVLFSFTSVVVEVEVDETTTGKVLLVAIVCEGNVGVSSIGVVLCCRFHLMNASFAD